MQQQSQQDRQENGAETISEEKMDKNFPVEKK